MISEKAVPPVPQADIIREIKKQPPDFWKNNLAVAAKWTTNQSEIVQRQFYRIEEQFREQRYASDHIAPLDLLFITSAFSQAQISEATFHGHSKYQEFARRAKAILHPKNEDARYLEKTGQDVERINALEKTFDALSDDELRGKTMEFKTRLNTRLQELAPNLQKEIDELKTLSLNETSGKKFALLRQKLEARENKMLQTEKKILDELLPEAFAAVREASKRHIGLRHFDCQLVGGMAIHDGKIAEMKTGEGKTLVATLPLYLNALAGHGVHLVTTNEYLAKTGVQWMGPVYEALGMSVGLIEHEASYVFDSTNKTPDEKHLKLKSCQRKEAYRADITYGTNNEFGFDYLRDNMVSNINQCVSREPHFAIIDEVDNILIDEARTPLIISGPGEKPSELYVKFTEIVKKLKPATNEDKQDEELNGDYTIDQKTRNATLTEKGIKNIQQLLGINDLYENDENGKGRYGHLIPYLDNALRANVIYKKDKDYIVKNGEIIIVDEFTGRLMPGRRYSEGLHQALEAKEGLSVQRESVTYGEITFQNFFRMYKKLAGMTGTAKTEEEEFRKVYNMEVIEIPPNKPVLRIDHDDLVFQKEEYKLKALVEEIKNCYEKGQPVLIGTPKIEDTEKLHAILEREGIPHNVLNAKENEKESLIIAQAGRPKAVTVATNMAGRGVDILLGGNPELLAREELKKNGADLQNIPDEVWEKTLKIAEKNCAEDRKTVLESGGLAIIGTSRQEARRIDNQLRGRAGRQGDPGSSKFYVSMEDELMLRFGGERIGKTMEWAGSGDQPMKHKFLSKSFEKAQATVEGYNFDIRKHILEFDDVINVQRGIFYRDRRRIVSADNPIPVALNILGRTTEQAVDEIYAESIKWQGKAFSGFNVENFWQKIWERYQLIVPPQMIEGLANRWSLSLAEATKSSSPESQIENKIPQIVFDLNQVVASVIMLHENLWEETPGWSRAAFQQMLKTNMLQIIDQNWINHMGGISQMLEGIGLRAFGQKVPLLEYKKEASEMFEEFNEKNINDLSQRIMQTLAVTAQAIQKKQTLQEFSEKMGKTQKAEIKEEVTSG